MEHISTASNKINVSLPDIRIDEYDNIITKFSRIDDAINGTLQTLSTDQMNKVIDRIDEFNYKVPAFCKSDSHTTRRLFTTIMMQAPDSTYRVIRQLFAQMEKSKTAISDYYFSIKGLQLSIQELRDKENKTDKDILSVTKKVSDLTNTYSYFEAAIKELGTLQDAYEEIKRNKNIPDDWSEADFEADEVKASIRLAFRNAVRDILNSGSINMGTLELCEGLGISPFEAIYHTKTYIIEAEKEMKNNNPTDYDNFQNFLDAMVERFKDNYKKALRRLGFDSVSSDEFLLQRNVIDE